MIYSSTQYPARKALKKRLLWISLIKPSTAHNILENISVRLYQHTVIKKGIQVYYLSRGEMREK